MVLHSGEHTEPSEEARSADEPLVLSKTEGTDTSTYYVYILLCSDGSLYTGISNNPDQRFKDHKNGKGGRYTRLHKPVNRVYLEKIGSRSDALKRELQIKGWTRKKKIKILKLNI
jgi:putative endonuclease